MFDPGFRLSLIDILVLLSGAGGAWVLYPHNPNLSIGVAFVVAHFFLFCNIIRMSRIPELIWAFSFIMLSWLSLQFEFLAWNNVLYFSVLITLVLILREIRRPCYHGVLWRRLNPQLPDWFSENLSTHKPSIEPVPPREYQCVFICGPANQSENDSTLDWMADSSELNGLAIDVNTLGAAIAKYCEEYGVEIIPYDGQLNDMPSDEEEKYFLYTEAPTHSEPYLVDVHVKQQSGKEVCPKQNLLFPVAYGDIIYIHSTLIC